MSRDNRRLIIVVLEWVRPVGRRRLLWLRLSRRSERGQLAQKLVILVLLTLLLSARNVGCSLGQTLSNLHALPFRVFFRVRDAFVDLKL